MSELRSSPWRNRALLVFIFLSVSASYAIIAPLLPFADFVVGQPAFDTRSSSLSATTLSLPIGLAVDSGGRLYVADHSNQRVLVFNNPAGSDTMPDQLIGQLTYNGISALPTSASSMTYPSAIALSQTANLFVADGGMSNPAPRILVYVQPSSTDAVADRVIGQPSFTTQITAGSYVCYGLAVDSSGNLYASDFRNNRIYIYRNPLIEDTVADFTIGASNTWYGGASATKLDRPCGLVIDSKGRLFVCDAGNNRVLIFENPMSDSVADFVLGQPSLTTNTSNNGGVSPWSLDYPYGITIDTRGVVYVTELFNSRIMLYANPSAGDTRAVGVLGQPDLYTAGSNNGGLNAGSLNAPYSIVTDSSGYVFVADGQNNRVLRYRPSSLVPIPSINIRDAIDPRDTVSRLSVPVEFGDTYVQLILNNGGITSSVLLNAANESGRNANYSSSMALSDQRDSLGIYIWTNQSSAAIMLGLRGDTGNINMTGFAPTFSSNNGEDRKLIGQTVLQLRFADSTGRTLGSSGASTNISDTFVYTLEYYLSETTCNLFRQRGIAISADTTSLRHYYAGSIESSWTVDTHSIVTIALDGARGGAYVRVTGIRVNGAHALSGQGSTSSSAPQTKSGACLLQRFSCPTYILGLSRVFRDLLCESYIGRMFVALYYAI